MITHQLNSSQEKLSWVPVASSTQQISQDSVSWIAGSVDPNILHVDKPLNEQ